MPFTTMNLPARQPSILPHTLPFFCPCALPTHFKVGCKDAKPLPWNGTPSCHKLTTHTPPHPPALCCVPAQLHGCLRDPCVPAHVEHNRASARAAASSRPKSGVWVITQASSGGQAHMRICTRGQRCFRYPTLETETTRVPPFTLTPARNSLLQPFVSLVYTEYQHKTQTQLLKTR